MDDLVVCPFTYGDTLFCWKLDVNTIATAEDAVNDRIGLLDVGIFEGQICTLSFADVEHIVGCALSSGMDAEVVGSIDTDDDGVVKVVPILIGIHELKVEDIARHAGRTDDCACERTAVGVGGRNRLLLHGVVVTVGVVDILGEEDGVTVVKKAVPFSQIICAATGRETI